VKGEVLDVMYQVRLGGMAAPHDTWSFERALVDPVASI
jgi:hypothetical protein